MGAGLLFWAAQHGHWTAGGMLAILIELPNLVDLRWELSLRDFIRVWELCILFLLGGALYSYVTEDVARVAFGFAEWLPVFLAPMALAQACSTSPLLPFGVLNPFHREKGGEPKEARLNTGFFYLAACLVAASVSNQRNAWFYPGLCILVGWGLWGFRPRTGSAPVWLALYLFLAAVGYAGQSRMSSLQSYFETKFVALIASLIHRMPDATESWTSIGAVGRRQMSARIALRVTTKGAPPYLLRQAGFNVYRHETWHAPATDGSVKSESFSQVMPENSNSSSWVLRNHQTNLASVQISLYLPGGKAVLPLPCNVFRLDDLPANYLETNRFGAVKVSEGPGLAGFEARYNPAPAVSGPPDENDRRPPPPEEVPALQEVIDKLQLSVKPLPEVMTALQNYFSREYTYSAYLPPSARAKPGESPLAKFLLQTKSGHCEYFATATTLLLRQLHFPARYVVGYAVGGRPDASGEYLVREHDAHAWCEVYYYGSWVDLDTTPGTWAAIETARTPFWQPAFDFFSGIWFGFSKWRWLGSPDGVLRLFWLFIPVGALLTWRIVAAARKKTKKNAAAIPVDPKMWPGLDSEFYRLEHRLRELGLERDVCEAARPWLDRIRPRLPAALPYKLVQECVTLHYRYRFDPSGISEREKATLTQNIQQCLSALARNL